MVADNRGGKPDAAARRPVMEEAWDSFRKGYVHPEAGDEQLKQMRAAFYAGAWQALAIMDQAGQGLVPERQAARLMEEMMAECRRFKRDVAAGLA